MTTYIGVNGVTRELRAIDIGKGYYPDHIDTVLAGVNGVWRKAMTLHEIVDHVELVITSKDSNIGCSVSSTGFTAEGYFISTQESVYASVQIILKDGHRIFEWASQGQYLLNHYTFVINARLYVYCSGHSGTINGFSICGNDDGFNFSGNSAGKMETYTVKGWRVILSAERCDVSLNINSFTIDGVSYPVRVVNKLT